MAAYLAHLADRQANAATIARHLVVISQAHKAADLLSPTTSSIVSRTHAGIRRTLGTAQQGTAPALVDDLKRMLEKIPSTRAGLRDRVSLRAQMFASSAPPTPVGNVLLARPAPTLRGYPHGA